MPETIKMGALTLNFLQSKDETGGSLDMFEMIVQPNARMPVPHYHESWDETVYGLSGTMTFRVDGKDTDIAPGQTVFIKRGIVHSFTNNSGAPATCLATLTPGVRSSSIVTRSGSIDTRLAWRNSSRRCATTAAPEWASQTATKAAAAIRRATIT